MQLAPKTPPLDQLRDTIARLERAATPANAPPPLPLGPAEIDAALPGGGLPLGALHERAGNSTSSAAAADGRAHGSRRHAMRRVVSVWLPHWPTDRLRRTAPDAPPRDAPVVSAAQDGNRRVLQAVDPAAAALGLRPGLAV